MKAHVKTLSTSCELKVDTFEEKLNSMGHY